AEDPGTVADLDAALLTSRPGAATPRGKTSRAVAERSRRRLGGGPVVVSRGRSDGLAGVLARLVADDNGRRGGTFGGFLAVDGIVIFLAVDRDLLGCDDTQADLIATDLHHGHDDVVVNDDRFVFLPGQYEHRRLSFPKSRGCVSRADPSSTAPRLWRGTLGV